MCQHSRYVHSGYTVNTCRFNSYAPLLLHILTQLPENSKGYHRPSTDFYVNLVLRVPISMFLFVVYVDRLMVIDGWIKN
ncbi:hypothetical protein T07_12797 [Trichinella nelsoni]|uniref:Uncharacterized protein n=1 Tax=Trichinella nelsoni TaxID=6336 RepID=A0A0V0RF85_9BILA|nr:hypothetical protein T07_12797 [Trichinella nelsoni]